MVSTNVFGSLLSGLSNCQVTVSPQSVVVNIGHSVSPLLMTLCVMFWMEFLWNNFWIDVFVPIALCLVSCNNKLSCNNAAAVLPLVSISCRHNNLVYKEYTVPASAISLVRLWVLHMYTSRNF